MSYTDRKITQEEINAHHVQGATDYLIGNPQQNKAVFDNLPEFIAGKFNDLIDEIAGQHGDEIRVAVDEWLAEHPEVTTTVQDNSLTTAKYANGSVTPAKLDRTYATPNDLSEVNENLTTEINVLDARMDEFASLPEGSTSGNAELVDIRVGVDGETYQNAGGAVRGQVADLKSDLGHRVSYLSKDTSQETTESQITFPNENKIVDEDGSLYTQNGYAATDYIDLTNVTGIYRTGQTAKFTLWRYAFYDASYNLLSVAGHDTNYDIVEYDGKQVTWLTLNTNAKYIRICWDTSRAYEYYAVSVVSETVNSYTLPDIIIKGENIYDDAVAGKNAGLLVEEITEETSTNILNPTNFKANGYYLNFTDGVTHVSNDYYLMTTEKIHTGLIDKLYVRQNYSTSATNNFLVYCYAEDTYLGYVSNSFADYGSDFAVNVKEGTTDIRIFSNVTDGSLTGDMICVSVDELDEFVAYNPVRKITEDALPSIQAHILNGKHIVFLGDSIFGNIQSASGIANVFANLTGAKVSNFAFGGTQATLHTGSSPYALGWQKFDGVSVANSIANNDYDDMDDAIESGSMSQPAYFATTLAKLKVYDWSKCDYIIADWGTNDWTGGASVNDYKNALKQIVQTILTAYPQIVFVEVTPFVRFFEDGGAFYNSSIYDYRHDGVYLKDFADAVSVLAEQPYNLQVVDCYNIGINDYTRTGFFSNNDWTHHDSRGRKRIATYLANKIC